jgi:outer membrane protein assembly factor BamB
VRIVSGTPGVVYLKTISLSVTLSFLTEQREEAPIERSEAINRLIRRWRDERIRLARLRYEKRVRLIIIGIISLLIVCYGIYYFADVIVPPEGTTSDSLPGEWAMFRRDPVHSGDASPGALPPQGIVKWTFPTGDSIHSSPAVANGMVYIGSRDGKLYALDAETGEKRWEFQTRSWVESSPTVANDVVYFGSNDGKLYALDAHTGEKLWDFKTPYPVKSSPAVADGMVYFGSFDFCVYALKAANGEKIWRFQTDGIITSSPVVADGIVYVGSMDRYVYALHTLNGRLQLQYKTHSAIVSSPAVSDNIVYVTSCSHFFSNLYAIDGKARNWPFENDLRQYWLAAYVYHLLPQPPELSGFLWKMKLSATSTSSPAVINDTLYIGSDNKLHSIDIRNRQELWTFKAGGEIISSPAVAGNTIYAGSKDGHLYALDITTGEKLWDLTLGGEITSSPAVANTMVYIGSHDGNLYAIR